MSAVVHHYSHLDLLNKCPRKYVAKHLHKLPDEKGPSLQDGIDLHDLLDRMLTDGPEANTDPESKIGGWARALYPLAPAGALPEISHTFELFGMRAGFKIDWTEPGFAYFGDWKTSAAPEWALAEEGSQTGNVGLLKNDIQANLYAYGFMKVFGLRSVTLEWCYVFKKSGKAEKRRHLFYLEEVEVWLRERVLPLMLTIEYLHKFSAANGPPPIQSLPFDQNACKRRNGISCAYLGQCQFKASHLTKHQLIQIGTEAMSQTQQPTFAPMNPADPPAPQPPVGPPPSVAAAAQPPPPADVPQVTNYEPPAPPPPSADPKPRVEPPKRKGAKAKLADAEARIAELETQLATLASAADGSLLEEGKSALEAADARIAELEARLASAADLPSGVDSAPVAGLCEALERAGFQVNLKYIGVVV